MPPHILRLGDDRSVVDGFERRRNDMIGKLIFGWRLLLCLIAFAALLGLGHAAVLGLAEFRSIYDIKPAFGISALFSLCLALSSVIVLASYRGQPSEFGINELMQRLVDRGALKLLLILSVVGCIMHIYAKYSVTYIVPISCIFEIRFAWEKVPRDLLPISVKISSVMGHILVSMALPALIISGWKLVTESQNSRQYWVNLWAFGALIVVGIVYAGFMGSRNAMLLFFVVSLFGLILGLCRVGANLRVMGHLALLMLIPLTLSVAFSSAVFLDRMTCNDDATQVQYLKGFEDELPVVYVQSDPGSIRAKIAAGCEICNATFLYLSHGVINLAKVAAVEERGKPALSNSVFWIFSRLGVDIRSSDDHLLKRVYGNGGLPLAGSAYHDYGLIGTIVVAIGLGVMVGFAVLGISGAAGMVGTIGGLIFLTCYFYTTALSYMFTATGVMFFPFLAFGCLFGFAGLACMPERSRSKDVLR